MQIGELEVEVVEKDIKNLHLAVYPPDGRVRLATPREINPQTLELFVISKISWIRKQQRKFAEQNRQSPRLFVNRESHYFLGKKYLLRIHEGKPKNQGKRVQIKTKTYIELFVRSGSTKHHRAELLKEWYRDELRRVLDSIVSKWEKILGISSNEVFIKTMKTKWGSCNPKTGNIMINLELAKKPLECIEYIVAHELTHLIEPTHNSNFRAHLDYYLPNWKQLRDELNRLPVGEL